IFEQEQNNTIRTNKIKYVATGFEQLSPPIYSLLQKLVSPCSGDFGDVEWRHPQHFSLRRRRRVFRNASPSYAGAVGPSPLRAVAVPLRDQRCLLLGAIALASVTCSSWTFPAGNASSSPVAPTYRPTSRQSYSPARPLR